MAPLAPQPGLPELISDTVRGEFDGAGPDAHSATWISWGELQRVDRDERAATTDRRVHEYEVVNGARALVGKAGWSARFTRIAGLPADPATGYGRLGGGRQVAGR
nr:hypothetical protein OG461_18705 [Streptomyces sp. NBC_00995]